MMVHVLFVPLDAYGHINSCIGIAEKLCQLGHRVTFALESAWRGKLAARGFAEAIYTDPSRQPGQGPNDHWIKSMALIEEILDRDSLYKAQHQSLQEFEEFAFDALHFDDQLREMIERVHPDVIVVDHYFTVPAIYQSGRKWVHMTSATPLSAITHPDTPPTGSGYPTDGDRNQWQRFRETLDHHYGPVIARFNRRLIEMGLPSLPEDGQSFHPSPYLNIYAYPEALDYLDIRPLPEKWRRFDHFIRSRDEAGARFELPQKLHRLPSGWPLVYVSMGSLGCAHLKLTQRLVAMLAGAPYRIVMVMGPNHHRIELPENIYGGQMLPQVEILPMVQLVITHGGNNSVLESLYHGKPMIINPLFYDQYDNAQRAEEKGVGRRINLYTCSRHQLLQMIDQMIDDEEMNGRCAAIGQQMQRSNSPERAAKAIIEVATTTQVLN